MTSILVKTPDYVTISNDVMHIIIMSGLLQFL